MGQRRGARRAALGGVEDRARLRIQFAQADEAEKVSEGESSRDRFADLRVLPASSDG